MMNEPSEELDNEDSNDNTDLDNEDRSHHSTPLVVETYCHHHIRNVWWGGLIKYTTQTLKESLAGCLDDIESRLRVAPNMQSILRSLDKCFSLPANYPKGNGVEFKHFAHKFHPGVPLYPVQRSTGARNDMVLEGAVAAYINGWLYKEFLDEGLTVPDASNILQENLFIILSSVEMTALSCLYAIIHYSINMPMRWLAGKTHALAEYDWSVTKMATAVDRLHDALVQIEQDGKKIADEDYMLSIFEPLKLSPLDNFMSYIFDVKRSPTTSNSGPSSNKNLESLGLYIKTELFAPTREENQVTTDMLKDWGSGIASCLLGEMRDPTKLTSLLLSSEEGRLSWLNATTAEHEATKGRDATNDYAESPFGILTAQLEQFGCIGVNHAAGMALAKFNKDLCRKEVGLSMTKKKRKRVDTDDDVEPVVDGYFHKMDLEMTRSAMKTAVELSSEVRAEEKAAIGRQKEKKRQKKETLIKKRLDVATKSYIDKLHYREMHDSPACWKDCRQVDAELKKLKSESAKKEALKDQIRIRVLGLGWDDCHHPWSIGGTVSAGLATI